MSKPFYFDYAATTPVDERVADQMIHYLTREGVFGNPSSSTHAYGIEARKAVEEAREQVAALIHAQPMEIIWTSGATESNNLVLSGVSAFYQNKGRHIITVSTEHKSVLNTCHALAAQGIEITFLEPNPNGLIDLEALKSAIRPDTILISVMHVNNEIGVIQDIEKIGALARSHNILFHTDAAQSAGKLPINLQKLPVDFMSFSSHKIYGPKGMGALYIRHEPHAHVQPLMYGGAQEQGLRAGTLATHQIVGMGMAFNIAAETLAKDHERLWKYRNQFISAFSKMPAVTINSHPKHVLPGILNVTFHCVEDEALILALRDLAFSTGSACTSSSAQSSHVLHAIGLSDRDANSSIRLSFGRFTTDAEVHEAIQMIETEVAKLRAMSPLWDRYLAEHQRAS